MDRSALLHRIEATETAARAVILDGLLESTKLTERREWLASLDLLTFELDALRGKADLLLGEMPEDSARAFLGWVKGQAPAMLARLKDSTFARRSRRVHMLGLVDQWEFVQALLDQAVQVVYADAERAIVRERLGKIKTDLQAGNGAQQAAPS